MKGILSPISRARGVLDIAWGVAFVILLTQMIARPRAASVTSEGVRLELAEGTQQQGLYRGDVRLAGVERRVERYRRGWRLVQRYQLGGAGPSAAAARRGGSDRGGGGQLLGEVALVLHRDLSLAEIAVDLDISRLPLAGGVSAALQRRVGKVKLRGKCAPQRGTCRLRGSVGATRVNRQVDVGRGPVLPGAVYPLLARGALGGTAELTIFDPLLLRSRTVSFSVEGKEPLELRGQKTPLTAIRVRQQTDELGSTLWLDERGRVLRHDLPLGLRIEHERWEVR